MSYAKRTQSFSRSGNQIPFLLCGGCSFPAFVNRSYSNGGKTGVSRCSFSSKKALPVTSALPLLITMDAIKPPNLPKCSPSSYRSRLVADAERTGRRGQGLSTGTSSGTVACLDGQVQVSRALADVTKRALTYFGAALAHVCGRP